MNPTANPLGVLSGEAELRIAMEPRDIALVSVGVFLAVLLALIIARHLFNA